MERKKSPAVDVGKDLKCGETKQRFETWETKQRYSPEVDVGKEGCKGSTCFCCRLCLFLLCWTKNNYKDDNNKDDFVEQRTVTKMTLTKMTLLNKEQLQRWQ